MTQEDLYNRIKSLREPFIAKNVSKTPEERVILKELCEMGKIQSKKIGSAIVYWTPNIFSSEEEKVSIPKKNGISSAEKKGKHEIKIQELQSLLKGEEERNLMLEKEIKEMKLELMDLRKQVHQQTLTEDFDNPWKEIAFNMAQILADTKGITIRETLIHFGASEEAF